MERPSRPEDRTANLLGALALAVADRLDLALRAATGRPGSDTAALVILSTELTGASQDTLGQVLALSQPGVARLVDRLVAAGLLERGPGPDGRTHALAPTPVGREIAGKALRARAEAMRGLVDGLDAEDQAQLSHVLARLLQTITEDRSSARRLCRLCDPDTCGHPDGRCPVTNAVDAPQAE
jgi:MarR family transcriptional regulator, negative regulator of the multidrug operon emrRAB